MIKSKFITLGIACTGFFLNAQTRTTTFKACSEAEQKLEVPDQVHIIQMCQATPEIRPVLSLVLSDNGIEVYRIEYPSTTAKTKSPVAQRTGGDASSQSHYPFTVRALLVYQDEHSRTTELNMLLKSPGVNWFGACYSPQNGTQYDWGSIVSFKYETAEFVWLNKQQVILTHDNFFAPISCMTHKACINDATVTCGSRGIESNEIGSYDNYSLPPLGQDSFLYRVATLLKGQASSDQLPH